MTPEAFRRRLRETCRWIEERRAELGLNENAPARFRRAAEAALATPLMDREPWPWLVDLFDRRRQHEHMRAHEAESKGAAWSLTHLRSTIRAKIDEALASDDALPSFLYQRNKRGVALGGGASMRYWSCWSKPEDDSFELSSGAPPYANLTDPRAPYDRDSLDWIDFGARYLDALAQSGWEEARHQALAAIRREDIGPDPSLETIRAYRDGVVEVYGFLPGLNEAPFVLGRLAHLLGLPGEMAMMASSSHLDDELNFSVRLEVQIEGRTLAVWASEDDHNEPGLPAFEVDTEEPIGRRALELVVAKILEAPVLAELPEKIL